MPDLEELNRDPTLDALNQQLIRDNPPTQRTHLGGSVIGQDCERALWYSFRWALENVFDAVTLARFSDGHASEAIVAERLRAIPDLRLWAEAEDGNQYGYTDLGGHLRMHLDGVIKGLVQAPKTPHVWEHKCVNERKFRALKKKKAEHGEKNALEHWDTTYFGQAQMYCGQSGLKRHYLTVATPGSRELTSCRTEFQPAVYKWLMEKARRVVFSATPPPPISNKPDYYLCRWCNFADNCHGDKVARVNCRTCAHVTPTEDGKWRCEYHSKTLTNKEQRAACSHHVFIPDLIPFGEVTDMNPDDNAVTYRTAAGTQFVNADVNDWKQYQFISKDLQHLNPELLDSETDFFSLMAKFDGANIESVVKAKEMPKSIPASTF